MSILDLVFARDPWSELDHHLNRRLSQLPQDSSGSSGQDRPLGSFLRPLRVDIEETDKNYVFVADMPGLAKDNVHINVIDDLLTIDGETKEERKDKKLLHERYVGKFSRQFRLPSDAETGTSEAVMKNGVLELKFSKKEPEKAKVKEIMIKEE
ncbi:hypothetical protein HK098_001949 [Nowakowskiella sp. JEL0407]|nr:hypothetical protein HK098_001949 [Nowakowskiella sp. JEL0407]